MEKELCCCFQYSQDFNSSELVICALEKKHQKYIYTATELSVYC